MKLFHKTTLRIGQELQEWDILKASDLEVGLLVNFGRTPQFKRVIYLTARCR